MEVKPGYKQTEVGVFPEDWAIVRLVDISAFITKGATPTTYGFSWQSFGILFLRSECVSPAGLDLGQSMLISTKAHQALNRSAIQSGDLLITITGNVGRVVIVPEKIVKANINQHIARIRIVDQVTYPIWVYHFLSQSTVRQKFEKITTGQAYPQISLSQVRNAIIPRPSISEQHAIASALSDVDALLSGLDRFIAKKRDLKQAAMQQLLTGKTRLPGFSGEWEVKKLGDVIEQIIGGGTPSRSNPAYWGNEIPWVTVKDFATFNPRNTQEAITKIGLYKSASHLIPAGNLITSTRMALGRAVIYDVDVAINQDLKALYIKQTESVDFLYYWFEYNARSIDDLGSGSTVKGISISELKNIPFLGLPLTEQTAIATVLSDMDAELAALEARHDKTRQLKLGMMQELLTGRIRLV